MITYYGDAFVSLMTEIEAQNDEDIPITIGTVHSVKGMRYFATMYMETLYKSKYESEYIVHLHRVAKCGVKTLDLAV